MVLPSIVPFSDAVELAAIVRQQTLFENDLAKQFYLGQSTTEVESELKDVFALLRARKNANMSTYPFEVTDRSICFQPKPSFNTYTFLLLGHALKFGGPVNAQTLLVGFRRYFEDVVAWSFRKAGFASQVLSVPRDFRGINTSLVPALKQIASNFKEPASLRVDMLNPHDNDLDVDIIAMPTVGNSCRGGWPTFQVQCATGAISDLQSKLEEGSNTFGTVWDHGFFRGSKIRAVATADDLIKLSPADWNRLGQAGWVLDRTRISYLSSGAQEVQILQEVTDYWEQLWAARFEIDWQTGWQQVH